LEYQIILRQNRSSRSVNTSSSAIVEQIHQVAATETTPDGINFVYKVVNLSSGRPTSTTPKSPLVVVTAGSTVLPSDIHNNNQQHRYAAVADDDYYTVRSAFIVGLRVEDVDSKGVSYDADGTPNIQAGKSVNIFLISRVIPTFYM
jgi:hypothetical protein